MAARVHAPRPGHPPARRAAESCPSFTALSKSLGSGAFSFRVAFAVCLFDQRWRVWEPAAHAGPDLDDQSGRGLMLVDALAAWWGWDLPSSGRGKIVWALVVQGCVLSKVSSGRYGWPVSRFGGDGKRVVQRAPVSGPPGELPGTIEGLTVSFRELNDKRDRLEGDVEKFRRRVAEAEGELDQLQHYPLQLSWRPSQLEKQRLEQYRDKLRAHLGAIRSELDATKARIGEIRAVLVRQYAVAQASRRPVEALTVPCPACGQPSVPRRAAAAGRGWRKGWYECPADDCDAAWSAKWSGGAHLVVKMAGW